MVVPNLSTNSPPAIALLASPSICPCPLSSIFPSKSVPSRLFPSLVASSAGQRNSRQTHTGNFSSLGVIALPYFKAKIWLLQVSDHSVSRPGTEDNHNKQAMLLSSDDCDDDRPKLSSSESKLLTLPTVLTLGRVVAIPILLAVFYSNEWWAKTAVACIFVFAAITDWLDGFLARKMGSNSSFGAFLDPVADKLMVATTLVLLSTKPLHISWAASLPWLVPLPSTAIIGREITMSAVREWAASQGGDLQAAVAVNKLGKWKTASQMVALTILLFTRNGSESGMVYTLVAIGVGLLYISAGLALWSLFVYMKGIWGVLVK